jgi:hypothetical protein
MAVEGGAEAVPAPDGLDRVVAPGEGTAGLAGHGDDLVRAGQVERLTASETTTATIMAPSLRSGHPWRQRHVPRRSCQGNPPLPPGVSP